MVGHETSAGTISFTLDALARNQDCQSRLRDEIIQQRPRATRQEGARTVFDYDTLMDPTRMPYLDAVVKETLRYHPAVEATIRVATEDDVIPLSIPVVDNNGVTRNAIK